MYLLRHMFNVACFAIAFAMTLLWLYKYSLDEDIVQLNFKPFDFEEGEYPMLSFCLYDPFIDSKLKEYDETLTREKYLKILKGEIPFDGENTINFDDVSIDLRDFCQVGIVKFRNGSEIAIEQPESLQGFLQVTHSGFYAGGFIKCLGFKSNFTNIRSISLVFNSSMYPNGIRPSSKVSTYVALHLPNKLSLTGNSMKISWPKRNEKKRYFMSFDLQQLDILKRRNKRYNPCTDDQNFDQIILDEHLENVGCKASYHRTNKSLKVCDSEERMKKAQFDFYLNEKPKKACTSASTLSFTYDECDVHDSNISDLFSVALFYPSEYKEIIMKKEIDLHTLIGNAGAYIGLFLGTFKILFKLRIIF